MKIKTDPPVLQLGVAVNETFNIRDILRKVTNVDSWENDSILGSIMSTFINIFDIDIQNPHLELISIEKINQIMLVRLLLIMGREYLDGRFRCYFSNFQTFPRSRVDAGKGSFWLGVGWLKFNDTIVVVSPSEVTANSSYGFVNTKINKMQIGPGLSFKATVSLSDNDIY